MHEIFGEFLINHINKDPFKQPSLLIQEGKDIFKMNKNDDNFNQNLLRRTNTYYRELKFTELT